MKEPHGISRLAVEGCHVSALIALTEDAAIGQIVQSRTTAVFTTYDVIDLMSESGSAFWVKTVFTAVLCRRMTSRRTASGNSRGTRQDLLGARFCHAEYMFELKEIV